MLIKNIVWMTLLAVLSVPLFAADEGIGTVVSTDGTVTAVNKAGESRALSRRSAIFAGDTIKVAAASAAQIKFSDSSMMSLSQNTDFRVDSYKHENKPTDEFSGTIEKGTMRTLTGAISKASDSSYKVKTPVAAMGVRGTFYACHYDSEREKARCEFFQGSGFIENAMGRLDLGADERFSYGDVSGSKLPKGDLAQSDATYDSVDVAGEGGGSGAGEAALPEDSFGLAEFTDEELDAFEYDVDSDTGMGLQDDEIDNIEEDVLDPADTQTELTEDDLEGSVPLN